MCTEADTCVTEKCCMFSSLVVIMSFYIYVWFCLRLDTSQMFFRWKEWAVLHSYKRRQCQEEVEAGVAVLKRIRLRSYFHLWKKAKNVASAEKRLHDRATRHYESKMRVVAFQAWVLFR